MSDRELLELAAKAAGEWSRLEPLEHLLDRWNPLTDDGDALRLAVKLGIGVEWGPGTVDVSWGGAPTKFLYEDSETDRYAATRRAIVRAAAEIGRIMT